MALRRWSTSRSPGSVCFSASTSTCPLKDGKVRDDTRVREAAPTVSALAERGAVVIACSHLGRAKGKPDPALSLGAGGADPRPATSAGRDVRAGHGRRGGAGQAVAAARPGRRAAAREHSASRPARRATTRRCARALAALADVYVNDAFGTAHRAHASTAGVAAHFARPRRRAADGARGDRARPGCATTPSARSWRWSAAPRSRQARRRSRRSPARPTPWCWSAAWPTPSCSPKASRSGKSLAEPDLARRRARDAGEGRRRGVTVVLPTDVVVAAGLDAPGRVVPVGAACGADEMILDIGPDSRAAHRRPCSPAPGRCSGTARPGCSRSRRSPTAPWRSPAPWRTVDGVHRGRRRRDVAAVQQAGVAAQAVARLHGRRRLAGVPRRRRAARRRRAGGAVMRRPLHRRQLEDARHRGDDPGVPRGARRSRRRRRSRGGRLPAVHAAAGGGA